jgi:stage V sporulation protein R
MDMNLELKRLNQFDEKIQEIAREFGLDFFPQEFDAISSQKMLEILAYHFPVNFSHWSFGRDYERERTKYEYGFGIPYELVLNSNPSRAYLMNTNPLPVQVMVMAHVYAHNDFMKNNLHFKPTRRDILPSASEAAIRFQRYEKRFGVEEVERVIDTGLSIELNIDPNFFIREESEEQKRERLSTPSRPAEVLDPYDDLIPRKKAAQAPSEEYNRKTPPEPERDILLYIINHSPKPLKEWEKDILSVIRDQSRYFTPQRRTKIMNEGWATFWHMRIMDSLFKEGVLKEEEHGTYNLYNARVLATSPRRVNPYLVGLRIYEDIEDRWNKGRFGKEWEMCEDHKMKEEWNLSLAEGREKIYDVRRSYSDRFFIEHFLTKVLVDELELYLYEGRQEAGEIKYVISERDWRRIKRLLVSHLSTLDIPLIMVEDGDYKGKRQLYLKHAYEGIELDQEYREKTLEHIFYLWDRPIHLESMVNGKTLIFTFEGVSHSQSPKR